VFDAAHSPELGRRWDNHAIAASLFISASTVKHHVTAILHKLGVENRVQAAVEAVRIGVA
jgi:DNA-binding NarL/FixJ family response regulator